MSPWEQAMPEPMRECTLFIFERKTRIGANNEADQGGL